MRAVDENLVAIVKDNDLSMMRTEYLPERLLLTCFWKLFPAIFHLRVLDVILVVEKYHVEVAVEVLRL